MILALYLTVVALGAGATYAYAIRKESIAFTSVIATTAWGLAAMSGGDITLYHQDGSSTAVGAPSFQYVALGLAILSFMAFTLWYFGEYPPEDGVDDELDPTGAPTDGGV